MAATVLTHSLTDYNPKLPILMAGDASQYGIGAGIMHLMPNGSKQHYNFCVMYFIWNREAIYLEKVALSLIFGIKSSTNFCSTDTSHWLHTKNR